MALGASYQGSSTFWTMFPDFPQWIPVGLKLLPQGEGCGRCAHAAEGAGAGAALREGRRQGVTGMCLPSRWQRPQQGRWPWWVALNACRMTQASGPCPVLFLSMSEKKQPAFPAAQGDSPDFFSLAVLRSGSFSDFLGQKIASWVSFCSHL